MHMNKEACGEAQMMKYENLIMEKCVAVVLSCKTMEQVGVAIKFYSRAKELGHIDDYERCGLHGYIMAIAHTLGYRESETKIQGG